MNTNVKFHKETPISWAVRMDMDHGGCFYFRLLLKQSKINYMRQLLTFIVFILVIIQAVSCTTQRYCQPSKRSKDYAVLKEGSISKDHVKTMLVSVHRTMLGNKHIFLTDTNDTIVKYYNYRFCPGECYWVKSI